MFYDLNNNKYIENKKTNIGLKLLYNSIIGRLLLKIMTSKVIANIDRVFMNSKLSKCKIKKFIKKNNIDISEYENKNYSSFNDFFTRKILDNKRNIDNGLIAIADSKLLVYKIDNDVCFKIKNSIYTIEELIQSDASKYKGGYALVFRLSTNDYHHYIYPDNGKVVNSKKIKGILHTVQPISFKKYKTFLENSREVTNLNCKKLGNVCYIEVGAMLIGKINNYNKTTFKKGEEKGYFEFGGSTIILLVEKDKVDINKKILKNSCEGIETIVKLGNSLE